MYRIFCESYDNFLKSIEKDSYRVKITEPFELITDLKKLNEEKDKKSNIYKKLFDFLYTTKRKYRKISKIKSIFMDFKFKKY